MECVSLRLGKGEEKERKRRGGVGTVGYFLVVFYGEHVWFASQS